jgi:hypothetical protein
MALTGIQTTLRGRSIGLSAEGWLVINLPDKTQIVVSPAGILLTDVNGDTETIAGGVETYEALSDAASVVLQEVNSPLQIALSQLQATLVAGTNIKNINGASILGSGNLTVTATTSAGYAATSTTSRAISTGAVTFTTQADLAYVAGLRVRVSSTGSGDWMEGPVASYSGTTLSLVVDLVDGAGSHADWAIGIAGEPGADGAAGSTGPAGDAPVDIAYAGVIPLDTAGGGKKMAEHILDAPTTFTYSGEIDEGNCTFCLIGDGDLSNIPNFDAFTVNNYVYVSTEYARNVYAAIWEYETPFLFGRRGEDFQPEAVAGSLSSSAETIGASLDLEAGDGFRDYYHERRSTANPLQKAFRPYLAPPTLTNATATASGTTNCALTSTEWVWALDGGSVGSATSAGSGCWYRTDVGAWEVEFRVPATVAVQVLRLHFGGSRQDTFSAPGRCTASISLSDASASPITISTAAIGVDGQSVLERHDITFNSGLNGEELIISLSAQAGTTAFDIINAQLLALE